MGFPYLAFRGFFKALSLLSYLRWAGRCLNSKHILGPRKLSADGMASGRMFLELFLQMHILCVFSGHCASMLNMERQVGLQRWVQLDSLRQSMGIGHAGSECEATSFLLWAVHLSVKVIEEEVSLVYTEVCHGIDPWSLKSRHGEVLSARTISLTTGIVCKASPLDHLIKHPLPFDEMWCLKPGVGNLFFFLPRDIWNLITLFKVLTKLST